jgi:DNA-binding NarL/FixJ family response regulator
LQRPSGIVRTDTTRVALVSPHLLVRSALRCLLESRGIHVEGEAGTAAEARALFAAEAPDLVLVDVGATGGVTVRARAGAAATSSVVAMDQTPEALIHAIQQAASRFTRRRIETGYEVMKIQSLTRREREIVGLVGEGLKNHHIAGRLVISPATVRNHLTSILDKLDLGDRFELAVYAFRHGLVTYPQPGAAAPSAASAAR